MLTASLESITNMVTQKPPITLTAQLGVPHYKRLNVSPIKLKILILEIYI